MDQSLILQLQQQPVFTIETPGVYKVVPPSGKPYLQVVAPDTLESSLDYRLPDKKGVDTFRWTMVSPQELLSYLKQHGRTVGWLIPWLFFGLLLFAELMLREHRRE